MSAHISSPVMQAILPGGILIASLLGSAHCVGMCGGLVISFAKDAKGLALYHFGRLMSYAALGAIAGMLGSTVFNTPISRQMPWIASVLFGILLIVVGLRRLTGKPLHLILPHFIANGASRLMARSVRNTNARTGVFLLGALSAFLPCGWLYTFVLAAAATKSPLLGATSLTLFWAGTVPALSAAPMLFNKLTARIRAITPKLSGALMIGLGLFSLSLHASMLFTAVSVPVISAQGSQAPISAPSCPLHHLHGSK